MLKSSKTLILASFGLVLLLMAGLTAIGLTRVTALHERMEVLSEEHDAKIGLVFEMVTAARERAISLHRLALLTDPFEWDEEMLHFGRLAANFIQARDKLVALGLNPEEKRVLSQSLELAKHGERLQVKVAGLFQQGNVAEAKRFLLNEVIPTQRVVIGQLAALTDLQQEQERKATAEAASSYRSGLLLMGLLGLVAVALGAMIALYVMRRTVLTEQALFQEKERAQVTLDSIGDGVITTDDEGKVVYFNPVAEQLTGWKLEEVQGLALRWAFNVVDAFTRKQIDHPAFDGSVEGATVNVYENVLLVNNDGRDFDIESSVAPIRNQAGESIGSVLVFRDVTQARELAKQLAWQAAHDQLTSLINRREFDLRLTRLLDSTKSGGDQHALLYMDLDQFKVVNDTAGHAAGDEMLRQLADKLRSQIHGGDTLARLGGDEFGVLLEHRTLDEALKVANTLRKIVQNFRFTCEDRTFEVGVSIGLAPITAHSGSPANLMSCADAACYAAKDNGRNRVNVYSPEDIDLMQRQSEMRWVTDISKAFEEQRFRLYFQPILPLSEEQEDGHYCEILLRMIDVNGEVISPGTFMPAAERYGLMPVIDRWVIRTLFATVSESLGRAAGSNPPRICSINLSGASLNDEYFPEFLRDQISRYRIPPTALCFEITETVAISNLERVRRFMQELKQAGCRFSLDDFGSGMSSFAYLKDLPVDYLKIDGMFVKNMVQNPIDLAMVEAINRIGHVMGIQTIAEFVEDEETLEKLRILGVNYAQGYWVGMPAPLEL
ncbi:EAL domain-containing protein [Sulfuricella sp.]|uniref:EAL domain-containing protein n=1 Tax=Sulfuricella sp. TaxID=2099377 RepID=UPI002C413D5B|nr:EAL domain-containing protein [Sulfuricella sp.]HUX62707.1 EAL domain-containing protein [Sulfuricella sp.]